MRFEPLWIWQVRVGYQLPLLLLSTLCVDICVALSSQEL